MFNEPATILAVNPGTKYMAIALFKGMDLREWSIKTFKGRWSKAKFRSIIRVINAFIVNYEVDTLVIKRVHESRTSRGLEAVTRATKNEALRKGIDVYEYSIEQLKRRLDVKRRGNKRQLAERIAMEYPFLWGEFNKECTLRNAYYGRLFEAVALGHLALISPDLSAPCHERGRVTKIRKYQSL